MLASFRMDDVDRQRVFFEPGKNNLQASIRHRLCDLARHCASKTSPFQGSGNRRVALTSPMEVRMYRYAIVIGIAGLTATSAVAQMGTSGFWGADTKMEKPGVPAPHQTNNTTGSSPG